MSAFPPVATELAEEGLIGRAAMRKAAWRLIPLLALGYGIAYMDRVNISFAALQMNRDLHFSASIYGFGAGLFFVSYAACEVPSNLLLYRVGAKRWFARIMLTWGLLAMGMMFVKTPVEFYVMRFLLGAAEAGFFPGVMFYLASWFPAQMRARAISRFYISLPLGSVLMGSIAGALLDLQGKAGLAGWQWLFLIEGLPAVVLSLVYLVWLPVGPEKASWLSDAERQWIQKNLAETDVVATHDGSLMQALRDRRVWQFSLIFVCMLSCSYAYTFSAPSILKGLTAFNNREIGYLVAAMSLLGAPAMILNAMHSDQRKERYFHIVIPYLLLSLGYLVGGLASLPWVAVTGLAVAQLSFFSLQGPQLTLATTFLQGESAAAGIAFMNMIGMLGGFLGPWLMGLSKDHTGGYQRGLIALVVPTLICAGTILRMRPRSNPPGIA